MHDCGDHERRERDAHHRGETALVAREERSEYEADRDHRDDDRDERNERGDHGDQHAERQHTKSERSIRVIVTEGRAAERTRQGPEDPRDGRHTR